MTYISQFSRPFLIYGVVGGHSSVSDLRDLLLKIAEFALVFFREDGAFKQVATCFDIRVACFVYCALQYLQSYTTLPFTVFRRKCSHTSLLGLVFILMSYLYQKWQ